MSWGTTFTAEIFINRSSYETIYQLEEDIDVVIGGLQSVRERIMMYCASGCKGVYSKDCEDNPLNPIDVLHREVKDIFEYYDEQQSRLYDLLLLKDDWDEKEGKFKTAEVG